MISFFRKIRQKLLSQNRVTQYLAYAFGEIFLVTIGILIALQVNTLNEVRKDRKKEIYLLQELQKEFKSDSTSLERSIHLNQLKIMGGRIVKDAIGGDPEVSLDTLVKHSFFIGKSIFFESETPTYEEIISSGQLALIQNEELKNRIKRYKRYIESLESFNYRESLNRKETYNTHLYQYFEPEIMSYLWERMRRGSFENLKNFKIDEIGFFKDPESLLQVNTMIGVDSELAYLYQGNGRRLLESVNEEIRAELAKYDL